MSTTITAPQGFFQNDSVTPATISDLVSAVAAASGNISQAATSATAAAASATAANTSSVSAAASNTAAGTSATAAASSASAAAGSATTAGTNATNAASSATAAATSATSASGSASSATSSSTSASTSATNASNSASAAATSATNAAASATTASNAAATIPGPTVGRELAMVRVNGTGTAYEIRTPAQVLSDIGAAPLAGATFTGPTSINETAGSWSSFNYGKQLEILAGSGGTRNPAIAIADKTNTNLIGLVNNVGHAQLISGPAYTDTTTPPTILIDAATSGVALLGTNTNDNAAAGVVGEYISSTVLLGSAVALTNNTVANVTSISLTAGDWDVWGTVEYNPAGTTTMTILHSGVGTTSAAFPADPGNGGHLELSVSFNTGNAQTLPAGRTRLSLASTTTVYLLAEAQFGVSTLSAFGFIGARRVR